MPLIEAWSDRWMALWLLRHCVGKCRVSDGTPALAIVGVGLIGMAWYVQQSAGAHVFIPSAPPKHTRGIFSISNLGTAPATYQRSPLHHWHRSSKPSWQHVCGAFREDGLRSRLELEIVGPHQRSESRQICQLLDDGKACPIMFGQRRVARTIHQHRIYASVLRSFCFCTHACQQGVWHQICIDSA